MIMQIGNQAVQLQACQNRGQNIHLVKDANGCIAPFAFFFGYGCSIGFQVGFAGAGACGANGRIVVADPQGGLAPYTYSID